MPIPIPTPILYIIKYTKSHKTARTKHAEHFVGGGGHTQKNVEIQALPGLCTHEYTYTYIYIYIYIYIHLYLYQYLYYIS